MAVGELMSRSADLTRFYALLELLTSRVGGLRTPASLNTIKDWPRRGVYFFFEPGEYRSDSGEGSRVVRVGTHALTAGSSSTLRGRLAQHRGVVSSGGNHRGSIFRLLLGQALIARGATAPCPSWGIKGDLAAAAKALNTSRLNVTEWEGPIEKVVTQYVGAMPFTWLEVDDEPGSGSGRSFIERNAIALLSNIDRGPLDTASQDWLGRSSNRTLVRASGLWNQRHVQEAHDPEFLDTFERAVERAGGTH